jgi:hypothetical protein
MDTDVPSTEPEESHDQDDSVEVIDLVQSEGIPAARARRLIKEHGNSRKRLLAIIRTPIAA